MRRTLGFAISVLGTVAVWAQAPPPQVVYPVPIPGGDVYPPFINQFSPGDPAAGLDGLDAEPHGITNFRGVTAMGYTIGPATDGTGKAYQVITDVRVYQGDYVGATSSVLPGASASARAHGTFVEI